MIFLTIFRLSIKNKINTIIFFRRRETTAKCDESSGRYSPIAATAKTFINGITKDASQDPQDTFPRDVAPEHLGHDDAINQEPSFAIRIKKQK